MFNHATGKLETRNGEPVPRVPGVKLPCEMSAGQAFDVRQRACAKVAPDAGIELSESNRQAYRHYRQCRAIGRFPDDPLVIEHAEIIRAIEDEQDASRLTMSILGAMGARR